MDGFTSRLWNFSKTGVSEKADPVLTACPASYPKLLGPLVRDSFALRLWTRHESWCLQVPCNVDCVSGLIGFLLNNVKNRAQQSACAPILSLLFADLFPIWSAFSLQLSRNQSLYAGPTRWGIGASSLNWAHWFGPCQAIRIQFYDSMCRRGHVPHLHKPLKFLRLYALVLRLP